MADPKGNWLKLYRSLADWEYYKDGNTVRVFLDLMIRAELKPREYKGVTIERGQVVTTLDEIGARLGLSKKQIRTSVEKLKITSSIEVLRYPKFLVISILSWEKYQPVNGTLGHESGTQKGTQEGTQKGTQKKVGNHCAAKCTEDAEIQKGHAKGHDEGHDVGHKEGIPYILNKEIKKKEAATPQFSPDGELKVKGGEVDEYGFRWG